jgi:hypothetical protein
MKLKQTNQQIPVNMHLYPFTQHRVSRSKAGPYLNNGLAGVQLRYAQCWEKKQTICVLNTNTDTIGSNCSSRGYVKFVWLYF